MKVSWSNADVPTETGNISLNLTATKHLFQAIGGNLLCGSDLNKAK